MRMHEVYRQRKAWHIVSAQLKGDLSYRDCSETHTAPPYSINHHPQAEDISTESLKVPAREAASKWSHTPMSSVHVPAHRQPL